MFILFIEIDALLECKMKLIYLIEYSQFIFQGVLQMPPSREALLLEAVKQVKVSDMEDDILELPDEDPTSSTNMYVERVCEFRTRFQRVWLQHIVGMHIRIFFLTCLHIQIQT